MRLWLLPLLLLLAGCGSGASVPEGDLARSGGVGPTLAIEPANPPLRYSGPVAVRFVSFAAAPVRALYVGPIGLEGLEGLPAGDPVPVGTLAQSGAYTLRVEFVGRPSLTASVYLGWPTVTVYLFP